MLSREVVGGRIRQVRTEQHKTLRDVESASGFSSTHISEIERGRTSPTIGALIQIAHALEKDPSFFIEERELDEVCVTVQNDRPVVDPSLFDLQGIGIQMESMSHGILGGRLFAAEVHLEPGARGAVTQIPDIVDLCLVCLQGTVSVSVGGKELVFNHDDSLHATLTGAFELANHGSETAHLLVFMDPGMSPG